MFQSEETVKIVAEAANGLGAETSKNTQGQTSNPFPKGNSLFFNSPFMNISTGNIKHYIDKLKEIDVDNILTYIPVDKDVYTGIEYSCIAACRGVEESGKQVVYYYTILLTQTGRPAQTVSEIIESEVKARASGAKINRENFTYSDCFNRALDGAVRQAIKNKYGNDVILRNSDGIIFKGDIKDERVVRNLMLLAFNSIQNRAIGSTSGIVLPEITASLENKSRYYFNVESLHADQFDDLGNIKHANFRAELGIETIDDSKGLNERVINKPIVQVVGFIMPLPVTKPEIINGTRIDRLVISPNIVITDVIATVPDASSNVLAMAVAGLMGNQNNWVKVLMDTYEKTQIGALNYLLQIAPNNGTFKPIDFSGVTPEERALGIKSLFEGTPNISFDIIPNQCNNNLNFLTWAESIATNDKEKKYIEGSNADFDAGVKLLIGENKPAFVGKKIISKSTIPYGYVTNKKGEHADIRNITLGPVLEKSKGEDGVLYKSFMSMLTPNNYNAYNNYIEVVNHFFSSAVIEGKITRVTFNNEFINYLIEQVSDCVKGRIINKNVFQMPQQVSFDYNLYNQNQLNTVGLTQMAIGSDNNLFNYNYYNSYGYEGGRYF